MASVRSSFKAHGNTTNCSHPISGLGFVSHAVSIAASAFGGTEMDQLSPSNRAWTYAGLVMALFGAPAVVVLFKLAGFTRADFGATVVRELIILALVTFLFWIIRAREKLPLSSI